jgi:hypothetical protein
LTLIVNVEEFLILVNIYFSYPGHSFMAKMCSFLDMLSLKYMF